MKTKPTIFFFNKNQSDARISQILCCHKNSTCFGHFLCPTSGVIYCTFGNGMLHAGMMTAFQQGQGGTSSILTLLENCHQTCKKYTITECIVDNS
jgi:hypothetical protein